MKKVAKEEIRYRRWCLTIWKSERFPDKESVAQELTKQKVKFLIVGHEITSANEKEHFQTYVEWENGRSFSSIKKQFPTEANFSEAKGTAQQNIDYCSKTDTNALRIGYANLNVDNMFKGDIASNLVDIMSSFDLGEFPKLYEFIVMYPQFSDYIVKNYRTLQCIYDEIQRDRKRFTFHPQQQVLEIENDKDIPF